MISCTAERVMGMRNWDVYYCLGFETEIEGEPSGKEFPVNQSFVWDNETWRILSMYDFDNGPVFDLCKKVDFERSLKYHIKWDSSKPYLKDFPREKLEERQKDCPFGDNFDSAVTVGDCTLEYKACYSVCFDCASSTPPAESDASCKTVRHYGLDEDTVWAFRRIAFAWPDGGKPDF